VVEAPVCLESFVKNVESFETLHLLRKDEGEVAMIWRVQLKDSKATSYKSAMKGTGLLEREKDGSFVLFIKGRPRLPRDKTGFWTGERRKNCKSGACYAQ
jgi:hypothetical protein